MRSWQPPERPCSRPDSRIESVLCGGSPNDPPGRCTIAGPGFEGKMRAMELHALGLLDALRALREGRSTVMELIDDCSRRIAALDPEIRAWEWFEPSRAMAEAEERGG